MDQLSLIIIGKGLERIDPNPPDYIFYMYYFYLASVYTVEAVKFGFTRLLQGYSRGLWTHRVATVQLILQVCIVGTTVAWLTMDNLDN